MPSTDSETSLGPCCMCGGDNAVNIIMLHKLCPTPGRGWGCVQCGLPSDGAVSVLCEGCLANNQTSLKFACRGYPALDGRVPFGDLQGEFDHDLSMHPEVRRSGRTGDGIP